jgi:phosphatidylserine/phosphatidylglycerophosphate/cardiolipin synthase-like enzyme
MTRIFSNGPRKDYVINPFNKLAAGASQLFLAAPYFTHADPILAAVNQGKRVQLLVGLNAATSPQALRQVHEVVGLAVRYLTSRFHAKIFIFNDTALLGSSNLTDGGFYANREAVICLDQADDIDAIEDIRALFLELWEAGQVLTREKLDQFAKAHAAAKKKSR